MALAMLMVFVIAVLFGIKALGWLTSPKEEDPYQIDFSRYADMPTDQIEFEVEKDMAREKEVREWRAANPERYTLGGNARPRFPKPPIPALPPIKSYGLGNKRLPKIFPPPPPPPKGQG